MLADKFYEKVKRDPLIGHFFTKVISLSWETHIPVIVSFWEGILLGGTAYRGNPMSKHIELSRLSAIRGEHFARWVELWSETVMENFEGPKADEAIARARSIAQLMELKIGKAP